MEGINETREMVPLLEAFLRDCGFATFVGGNLAQYSWQIHWESLLYYLYNDRQSH